MGTRSRIGVMHGDNVKSVYCHWDGYLEHNGLMLQEHYDSVKANQLVALGDLSSLRPEIGIQHAFSQFDLRAEEVASFKLLTENMCTVEGCGGEWYYIMRDGVWYVGNTYENDQRFYQKLVPLAEALFATVKEQA